MTPVRPTNLPQVQPGAPRAAEDARSAGQRAFFEAALGKSSVPAMQAQRTPPPNVYAQPVQRIPDPTAEAPQKILRPGSLLDIRV